MDHELDVIEIVHAGPPKGLVRERKAAWLDDIGGHVQAGRQAQQSAGILRNVGLVEGQADHGLASMRISRLLRSGSTLGTGRILQFPRIYAAS